VLESAKERSLKIEIPPLHSARVFPIVNARIKLQFGLPRRESQAGARIPGVQIMPPHPNPAS